MDAPAREILERARVALRSGAVAEALADLEKAYDVAVASRDRGVEAEILVETARGLLAQAHPDQAVLCVEQAIEAAHSVGHAALEGEALLVEADVLTALGNTTLAVARVTDAIALLDSAFAAARSRGDVARALDHGELARRARDRLVALAAPLSETRKGLTGRALAQRDVRSEQAARRREQAALAGLCEAAKRLVEERHPEKLVALVLDRALDALGAERGAVFVDAPVEHPAGGVANLRVIAARNFDRADVRRAEFKVSRTVIDRAIATREPLVVIDAAGDRELSGRSSTQKHKLRSIGCAPFEAPSGLRGVFYVDNRFREGTFTDGDLPALVAFAALAASSLENAACLEALERERRTLDGARAEVEALKQRLAAQASVEEEPAETRPATNERPSLGGIVGRAPAMVALYRLLEKLTSSDVPVLVTGESGTGKELVARALHSGSSRRDEPFVSENCAAIPETLLESTLFGHEKGAFTGASDRHAGLFELAGAGTLFLDEVGELTPICQAKLLRVLQERMVRRLGASHEIATKCRIVCATNRDLETMVREGRFREDLFYRLKVVSVRLPPLRERREDIPLLLETFCARAGARPKLAPQATRALLQYDWPGNVRELENEVRRLVALGGRKVGVDDLSPEVRGESVRVRAAPADVAASTLEEGERRTLVAALRAARGSKARAAEILAIPRGSLWHKIRQHRIADEEWLTGP